jgi:hypothetical protein
MIILRTFWVWHKDEEEPECTTAWDQGAVDENPEGWERAKQQIRDAYGNGIHSEREIEIQLDWAAVMKHWWPDPVEGKVA